MATGDRSSTRIRERVWLEKRDHTTETPEVVETIFMESEGALHGEATQGEGGEGSGEAADVEGQDGDQGVPRGREMSDKVVQTAAGPIDPWRTLAVIVRAAEETGIELERALKFVALMSAEIRPGAQIARQPKREQ